MEIKKDTGLPENYQKYQQLAERAAFHFNLRLIVFGTISGVSQLAINLLLPEEYQPPILARAFMVAAPFVLLSNRLPFNVFERGLYLEKCRLAREISTLEHWPMGGVFDAHLLNRAHSVIFLSKPLLPAFDPPKKYYTPDERVGQFKANYNVADALLRAEENPQNIARSVTRKALNIGEAYWQAVWESSRHDKTEDAMVMLPKIRKARAELATETHLSFADTDPLKESKLSFVLEKFYLTESFNCLFPCFIWST